ncbi:MAG TPA: TIGR03435 family protein, partial [Bryobacteraceae bacterium]|nr:TIGR03435 family protein [Bryobacteraceae bacterium]
MKRAAQFARAIALPFIASSLLAAADPPRAFELADVHSSDPNSAWAISAIRDPQLETRHGDLRGGRYQIYSATLVDLISAAWKIDPAKLLGGPGWLDTARFDVIAKVPADTTPASIPAMLQALLTERFHLQMHPETHPFPEFVLTAGPRRLM